MNLQHTIRITALILFAPVLSTAAQAGGLPRQLARVESLAQRGTYALAMDWSAITADAGQQYAVSLPGGKKLPIKAERIDRDERSGVSTLVAHHAQFGAPYDSVISYSQDGRSVFGVIYDRDTTYRIETSADGKVTLTDIKAAGIHLLPLENDAINLPNPPSAGSLATASIGRSFAADAVAPQTVARSEAPSPAPVTIDLSVLYSTSLVQQLGAANVPTKIANLVALANQAMANSQVNASYRVAGTHQVDYSDNDINTAYNDLYYFSAQFSAARAWRESDGADLVTFLRPYNAQYSPTICGLGAIGGTQTDMLGAGAVAAVSVVDIGTSCDDTSLAHELGHNLGAQHDQAHATSQGAYVYSYGYGVTTGSQPWGDVMSYLYPKLPIFSNPNLNTCNGQACGTSANNVAATFNLTAIAVSAYRQSKQGDPGMTTVAGVVQNQFGQAVWPNSITVTPTSSSVYCVSDNSSNPDWSYYSCVAPTGTSSQISIGVAAGMDPATSQNVTLTGQGANSQNVTFNLPHAVPAIATTVNLVDETGAQLTSSQVHIGNGGCQATMNGFSCMEAADSTDLFDVYDNNGNYWDSPSPYYQRLSAGQTYTFTRHPNHAKMITISGRIESTDKGRLFIQPGTKVSVSDPNGSCTAPTVDASFSCFVPTGSSGQISVTDSSHTWTTQSAPYSNAGTGNPPFIQLYAGPGNTTIVAGENTTGYKAARAIFGVGSAATEDAGRLKNVYIAAAVPGVSELFFLTQSGWQAWKAGPLPIYYQTTWDTGIGFSIGSFNQPLNLTGLTGTTVFMGIATSDTDLLTNQKYAPVYTIE